MQNLIGVCGYAGTGKDTVASFLTNHKDFVKLSFASPLKDAVSSIFGWDRELLEGVTEDSRKFREIKDEYWSAVLGKDITPRYMLQYFGTEVCRNTLHKNIWIESFKAKASKINANIVISDIRFINEALNIKDMGGYILYIERVNISQQYSHASEVDIELIGQLYADYTIHNFNSLEYFMDNIESWYDNEFN